MATHRVVTFTITCLPEDEQTVVDLLSEVICEADFEVLFGVKQRDATENEAEEYIAEHEDLGVDLDDDEECEHPNAVLSDDEEPATYHCPDCGINFVAEEDPDAL